MSTGFLLPITSFWQCWLIPVTSGAIKLNIMSMAPSPTPSPEKNQIHSNHLLHPSVSSNVVSSCSQTTPTTLDQIPIGPHQLPTGALRHPSLPIVFGASTNTQGIWASVPIHWTHNWTKTWHWFSSNPDPVSPDSNYFMLFDSLQPCAYYSCTHPWSLCSHIPVPTDSWLQLSIYKDLLLV